MDYSVIGRKPKKKPENPAPAAPPPDPGSSEAAPPPDEGPEIDAPPIHGQLQVQHGFYDSHMAYLNQISRVRRAKNMELSHSRTFRMNFGDDPYDCYHHSVPRPPPPPCRSTYRPNFPPPPPPYRYMPPSGPPPCCPHAPPPASRPPPPYGPPQSVGYGPPPMGYEPPPPMGYGPPPPPMGYPPYDGFFSDENPNGCIVM